MNLEQLFEQAVKHQQDHGCSAHPYDDTKRLIAVLQDFQPKEILEIGTGMGYTTAVMALTLPQANILTIEKDLEHVQTAGQFLLENVGVGAQDKITIIGQPAEGYLEDLTSEFDFIIFDGYQIHYEFLPHYERLLKPNGILFLANNHLQSKTSDRFFEELGNEHKWKILDRFADTTVAQRVSI